MTARDIQKILKEMTPYSSIYVPEFTYGGLRVDGIMVDTAHRWIRGFEIKVSKQDFKNDIKWVEYSQFCSSLAIVCPEGLIQSEEIEKPFGLLWIKDKEYDKFIWKKKAKNFQHKRSLSWFWTYTKVLELEFKRLDAALHEATWRIEEYQREKEK